MEPRQFEGRRSRKPRERPGVPGSAGHESVLLTDSGPQPAAGHTHRRAGPRVPPYQDYPGETATPRGYDDAGDGYGYGYAGNDRGDSDGGAYGYGYNRGGYGNGYSGNGSGYGTGPYSTGAHARGRQQADAPGPGWERANDRDARGTGPHPPWDEPAARDYPARQRPAEPRNGASVSMAARILTASDYEAASVRQQASYQAAMIARQAAEMREAAQREADEIRQQAALQATEVREAAEIEAAEAHAAVMSMQTELSDLAERIRNTLPHPVLPQTPPIERPAVSTALGPSTQPKARPRTGPQDRPPARTADRPPARPAARPTGKPAVRVAGKPAGRAGGKHGAQPAGKAKARAAERPASGQGRQVAAMRFAAIATSALFMVAVVAGAVEMHLHGFDFFIFRSAGTGETGPGGLQESQGPGQPDAPKPTPTHIKAQPTPHSTVTVHSSH